MQLLKIIITLLFTAGFQWLPQVINAQETYQTESASSVQKPESKHALYSGFGYGSNMLFSAISLSSNQPYLSTDLLYSFNKRWTASATIYNLPGIEPAIAFYDFSIGYRHTFNSYLDAGVSFSSYSTAKKLQDEYFGNFNYLTISGGLDWRILYTQLIYSSMFKDQSSGYLQIKNSHFFSTPYLFKKKGYFTFDPSVNMVVGDKYSSQVVITQTGMGNNSPITETTIYKSSFGLLDMEFSLPMGFNFGKTTFEMEPLYYLPIYEDPDFPAKKGLFLFINLYLKII